MNEQSQVCPWCQTDIIWDPEFGSEDYCPHCSNELKGYRSLEISLEADEEEAETDRNELTSSYEEAAEAYVFAQSEEKTCIQCQSSMIYTGQQEISTGHFRAFIPAGLHRPFLKPPFIVDVFVCPNCFQLSQQLGEKSKQHIIQSFQRVL